MTKSVLLILISFLICCSCSDRKLGDNYYFLPKYESIDVGYPNNEAIVYKSNQEYVFNNIIIRGDVLEINFNSKYIIAKRDPLISRDKNSGLIEYYIVEKKNDKIFGPLTKKDFDKKTVELNINLEFK
ncbi:Protein of unknown function [Maribacter dokdonensis]|uniref:DUF3997 domain-containing protein n=1 Tax=Maribacter dokdonensis TaxID=320912 RepID=A0A1H4QVU3_9FLAO|nr:DUF3997 domain-containing protein [Maribacter dokdonensis]SEC23780.1 Protein of unknown function [Maribacter dokdonensis]